MRRCPSHNSLWCCFAAERGYLNDVEVAKVVSFEAALVAFADREHAELLNHINQTGAYNDEIEGKLKGILDTFKATQSW
ncbi:ATP synthase subunit alpha [Serratia fonticola]|uniref:ATP synthase subunit alpha n=1 Tax=Serratia fonticola TaxID=47917 RepID=A0A4V6KL20_SERFO|nr:ATP synthase subunit alpha [Serratia fonticola]